MSNDVTSILKLKMEPGDRPKWSSFRIYAFPYPLHPLLYLIEEVPFLIQGFSRKSFSVQHLPW